MSNTSVAFGGMPGGRAAVAVGEIRRNDQAALSADPHAGDAHDPTRESPRPCRAGTWKAVFESNCVPLASGRLESCSHPVYATVTWLPLTATVPVPTTRSV